MTRGAVRCSALVRRSVACVGESIGRGRRAQADRKQAARKAKLGATTASPKDGPVAEAAAAPLIEPPAPGREGSARERGQRSRRQKAFAGTDRPAPPPKPRRPPPTANPRNGKSACLMLQCGSPRRLTTSSSVTGAAGATAARRALRGAAGVTAGPVHCSAWLGVAVSPACERTNNSNANK